MSQFVTLQLKNFPELAKVFAALPADVKEKTLRTILRAGATKIAAIARSSAPVRSGRIKGAITTKKALEGKWDVSHDAYVKSGSKRGDKKGAYYAAMVEFGHWATGRTRNRKGSAVKGDTTWVPAAHFMTDAFNQHVDKIVAEFQDKMLKKIAKSISTVQ